MKAGGLSVFSAGVLIVGAARLLIMIALFVLFDRLGGPRVGPGQWAEEGVRLV